MHQTTREDCIRDLDATIAQACCGARVANSSEKVSEWLDNASKAFGLRELLETERSIELALDAAEQEDKEADAAAKAEAEEAEKEDDEEPGSAVH